MIDSNNLDVMRNNIRKSRAEMGANTELVSELNALVGATPLPEGETTITHAIDTLFNRGGGDGVDYSTDEKDTGLKWIDDKHIFKKSFIGSVSNHQLTISTELSNVEFLNVEGVVTSSIDNGKRLPINSYESGYWYSITHLLDNGNVLLNTGSNIDGQYLMTLYYVKH